VANEDAGHGKFGDQTVLSCCVALTVVAFNIVVSEEKYFRQYPNAVAAAQQPRAQPVDSFKHAELDQKCRRKI